MTPAELEAALIWANKINMEVYYYWCTAIMVLIHAGFMMYEMGASRVKHTLAAGTKNVLAFAYMIPTFWLFGWWIYLAMTNGFVPDFEAGASALPWSDSMGPNLEDNATGVFWGAFTLFACTTASIMSGAVIERIRMTAFIILAVVLGSVVWILAASWGWHYAGWMVTEWGYHDFGASGVVHIISGFFALGVLIHLGPRIGKFNADGTANVIRGHSLPMTMVGLMLIVTGFFGFLGGCLFYGGGGPAGIGQWTNIYGMPTTLSAICFNTLMGIAGGMIGAYTKTRDPFWMMSGALCGVISVAAGMDLYYPGLAFILAFAGGVIGPVAAGFVEKMGIDDAVGAVAVHGVCGILGLLFAGLFLGGYPTFSEDIPAVTFFGQFKGMIVMVLLGFIPGYVLAFAFKKIGILRAGDNVQEVGMDVEIAALAYPEEIISDAAK
ncbi:MAG: ammonium transporter [Gammaproteobacteria bacterium]|jgi:ammonia channel protein AmtB|nr:ammonium transporter [Gammaproteobacteria bacterium]